MVVAEDLDFYAKKAMAQFSPKRTWVLFGKHLCQFGITLLFLPMSNFVLNANRFAVRCDSHWWTMNLAKITNDPDRAYAGGASWDGGMHTIASWRC